MKAEYHCWFPGGCREEGVGENCFLAKDFAVGEMEKL